jgi:glycosyltransferase involved in cell wall biosynthesis
MQRIRVLIPYKNYPGGPGTFIKNLASNNSDLEITSRILGKYDILLIIVSYSLIKTIYVKYAIGLPVILRLDGIKRPKLMGLNLLKFAYDYMVFYRGLIIYRFLSDFVVFQSYFSREEAITAYNKPKVLNKIIYNGIEENANLVRTEFLEDSISLVYWGFSINEEQAIMILAICNLNFISNKKIKFNVIGNDLSGILTSSRESNLIFYGVKELSFIYNLATSMDIFIMLKGSPCANALIEAMAHSLPVVGYSDGGNDELLGNNTGVTFIKSRSRDENLGNFRVGVENVLLNYHNYQINSFDRYNKNFKSDDMKSKYFEIIQGLYEKNLP